MFYKHDVSKYKCPLEDRTCPSQRRRAAQRADRELAARKYEHAASLAKQSLATKPDQPNALLILGNAKFALADFNSASDAYRRYLDFRPQDTSGAQSYADALYAARDRAGATKFKEWIAGRQGAPDPLLQTDAAGLLLIAGDGAPANALAEKTAQVAASSAPDVFARLGWWYYRAGQYQEASRLLTLSAEQRPGVVEYQVRYGWVLLEQQRYSSAIRIFDQAGGIRVGRAVAKWRGKDTDAALNDFVAGSNLEPQWLNAKWVQALYSPTVSRSVAEIRTEQEKRELARKARQ